MISPKSASLLQQLEIIISPQQVGIRLDRILAQEPSLHSRSRVAKLFASGKVQCNNQPLKPSYIPQLGDHIVVLMPTEAQLSQLVPWEFPLDILFEDQDVIVLNKPAGVVVHPSNGHLNDTLVNALVHHAKDLSMGFHENRPGIVHRLDKDTSGLLVVAKNDYAHTFLAHQFRQKTIHRIYWAIIFGIPRSSSGTIRSRLHRHPTQRKKFASVKIPQDTNKNKGKLAVTHYLTLESLAPNFSLVQCRLETGRTHQIRVHLSEMGHPIVGDATYGGVSRAKNLKSLKLRHLIPRLGRIALHARELSFIHPRSKKIMAFRSDWPTDLTELLQEIGVSHV